jgi:hypothetical protein
MRELDWKTWEDLFLLLLRSMTWRHDDHSPGFFLWFPDIIVTAYVFYTRSHSLLRHGHCFCGMNMITRHSQTRIQFQKDHWSQVYHLNSVSDAHCGLSVSPPCRALQWNRMSYHLTRMETTCQFMFSWFRQHQSVLLPDHTIRQDSMNPVQSLLYKMYSEVENLRNKNWILLLGNAA